MLFILLGVGENNKNPAKNKFTQTAQVLFFSFAIPSQTWLSAQSFSTQAPKVFSHAEHPLKATIPSTCHDKWGQLRSYCLIQLEYGAKLRYLLVFCLLSTQIMAKEAMSLKGLHWQPEGRQFMEVMKGVRYHFACCT